MAFTEAGQRRTRLRWAGKLKHSARIKTQAQPTGAIRNLKALKQPYADYERPPFAKEKGACGNL